MNLLSGVSEFGETLRDQIYNHKATFPKNVAFHALKILEHTSISQEDVETGTPQESTEALKARTISDELSPLQIVRTTQQIASGFLKRSEAYVNLLLLSSSSPRTNSPYPSLNPENDNIGLRLTPLPIIWTEVTL